MSADFPSLDEMMKALDAAMPDHRWKGILQVLAIKGIADTRQLQDATGFARDKLMRALDRITGFSLEGSPLISRLLKTIKQPGDVKRPPAIYVLAEGGAKLLHPLGFPTAHAFGLMQDDHAIAHVLSMVSVHILAERSGVQISTDQTLSYGEGNVLRPDHRIALAESRSVLIEVEQAASSALVARIKESLAHHQAFSASEESAMFEKEVRMLVNVKPGRDFDRTISIWQTAMLQLQNDTGERLNFRLIALPLQLFLSSPEWDAEVSERWRELDAEQANKSPVLAEMDEMPSAVRGKRSARDDAIILGALAMRFQDTEDLDHLKPDWGLFDLATEIYEAHYPHRSKVDEVAGVPMVSIYLLREYLNKHPDLRKSLNQAIHFNQAKVVWSQNNVLHRMGIVIRRFLSYHGIRPSIAMKAYAAIDEESKGYTVKCEVRKELLAGDEQETWRIEQAMAWVLLALFEYAQDLGLGRPDFW